MRSSPVMPACERPLGVFYTKQRFCLWWWEMHKDKKQEKETQILGTNNLKRGKGRLILVQLLSCVLLFATPWTAACQASLFFTSPGVYSNSCLRKACKASGSFPMSRLFPSGGQSIGASAGRVLRENPQRSLNTEKSGSIMEGHKM